MPTVRAISGEDDTARMAWPQREYLRNSHQRQVARDRGGRTLTRCSQVRNTGPSCTAVVEPAHVQAQRIGREDDGEQVLDQDQQAERRDEQRWCARRRGARAAGR